MRGRCDIGARLFLGIEAAVVLAVFSLSACDDGSAIAPIGAYALSADDTHVYYVDWEVVGRVPAAGGDVEVLSSLGGETWGDELVDAGDYVYHWDGAFVFRIRKADGERVQIGLGDSRSWKEVASHDGLVYLVWRQGDAYGIDVRDDAMDTQATIVEVDEVIRSVGADDRGVYWTTGSYPDPGTLWRRASDGTEQTVATDLPYEPQIVPGGADWLVLWGAAEGDGEFAVTAVPRAGGAAVSYGTAWFLVDIVCDEDDAVYWSAWTQATDYRIVRRGAGPDGERTDFVDTEIAAIAIDVNRDWVYWSHRGASDDYFEQSGAIERAARPGP